MRQVDFAPLARPVSCLGLGCARLDGRADRRRSARLIETALDLGITYFDVAASYGSGAAEEAVGQVIANDPRVVVATKHGPPLGSYPAAKMRLKAAVRPVLDRLPGIKARARGAAAPARQGPRPRYDFSPEALRRSLEQSLRRLRRDRADILLAHEPHPDDLTPATAAGFRAVHADGLIAAYGVGIGAAQAPWAPFGAIWQCGWPGAPHPTTPGTAFIYHGVLRTADKDASRRPPAPDLIRAARLAAPTAVFLVSASTPDRLRELVEAAADA